MKKDSNESDVNKGLKIIAKSSIIIFVGVFFSKIITYFYRIIIARYFGPEVYGLFSLAIMISGWFIIFSSLGFAEGLLRYLPWYRGKKEYNKIKYLIRFSTTLTLITSII